MSNPAGAPPRVRSAFWGTEAAAERELIAMSFIYPHAGQCNE